MTEAPGEFHLNRRVRGPARNPFADLLDGELQESPLRITTAVGDEEKAHLRAAESRRTLCGRVATEHETELAEALAAGETKGCKGCVKRAGPGAVSALCRASQLVARDTFKRRIGT